MRKNEKIILIVRLEIGYESESSKASISNLRINFLKHRTELNAGKSVSPGDYGNGPLFPLVSQ